MPKGRLESFSDGVIAIIITIMVLEMKTDHGYGWVDLRHLWPVFISYIMSFIKVAIYWKNHHHMLQTVERVNNAIIWSNLHWLFWLSMLPFSTGWMGQNDFAPVPVAVYSFNLFIAAISYGIVRQQVIKQQKSESNYVQFALSLPKGWISMVAYLVSIPFALLGYQWVSGLLIVAMAIMWLVPDKRVEQGLLSH